MSPEAALLAFAEQAVAMADPGRPVVIGLCGSQGSGKSTLSARVAAAIAGTAVLSLDDLYLTRAERQRLATQVHPLFATRGVPGTHDVDLGLATLDALIAGRRVALPRFDKARDDRTPESDWPVVGPARLILFEGWCVGARALPDAPLVEPINALERDEDAGGHWRQTWNAALAGDYQRLFARLDRLALLAAPAWETVFGWRLQQEHALRAAGGTRPGAMDDAGVARFISHYERLTRHILNEMPQRADLCLRLAPDRSLAGRPLTHQ